MHRMSALPFSFERWRLIDGVGSIVALFSPQTRCFMANVPTEFNNSDQ